MTIKKCSRCKKNKKIDNFHKDRSSKDGYSHRCKDCAKILRKIYYEKNKEECIKNTINSQNKRKQLLYEYLLEHPCECGESDPVCLEFDHLRDKEANISWAIGKWCWERVLKEIEKCQVLCANCHKKKTAKSQNWYINVPK